MPEFFFNGIKSLLTINAPDITCTGNTVKAIQVQRLATQKPIVEHAIGVDHFLFVTIFHFLLF
jgi:hypothetical protein